MGVYARHARFTNADLRAAQLDVRTRFDGVIRDGATQMPRG